MALKINNLGIYQNLRIFKLSTTKMSLILLKSRKKENFPFL